MKKLTLANAAKKFGAAMESATQHLPAVKECVAACDGFFAGDVPNKKQAINFAEQVTKDKRWSATTAKTRRSEISTMVRAYKLLMPCCEKIAASEDIFSFHDAVKVSRLIVANPKATTAQIAVAFARKNTVTKKKTAKQKAMQYLRNFMAITTTAKDVSALQDVLQRELDKRNIEI